MKHRTVAIVCDCGKHIAGFESTGLLCKCGAVYTVGVLRLTGAQPASEGAGQPQTGALTCEGC